MHRAKSPLLILKSIHLAGTKRWDKPFFCNRGAVDGLTRQALNTPGLKARGRNKRGMNLVDGGLGNKTVALRGSSGCFYYPRKIAVGNKMSILVNHNNPFISSYSPLSLVIYTDMYPLTFGVKRRLLDRTTIRAYRILHQSIRMMTHDMTEEQLADETKRR